MSDQPDKRGRGKQGGGDPTGDYSVGYAKPPKEHQFKKGERSKNPRGRPKRSRVDRLTKILDQKITITEGGKPRRVPLSEALDIKLVRRALEGDLAAHKVLIKAQAMFAKFEAERAPTEAEVRKKIEEERQNAEVTAKLTKQLVDDINTTASWVKKRILVGDGKGRRDLASWIYEEARRRMHGDPEYARLHYIEYVPYEPVGMEWKPGHPGPLSKVTKRAF